MQMKLFFFRILFLVKNTLMFFTKKKVRFVFLNKQSLFKAKEKNQVHYFCSIKRGFEHYNNGLTYRGNEIAISYGIDKIEFNKNDMVIDCGANVGDLFLYLKDKINHSNFFAVEPSSLEFKALVHNTPNAKNLNIALADKDGESDFFVSIRKADSSLIEPKRFTEKITVKTTTIDYLFKNFDLTNIKLLKLEAEGFEPEILEGAKNSIKYINYVAIDGGYERGIKQEETFTKLTNRLIENGFSIIFVNFKFGRALFINNLF